MIYAIMFCAFMMVCYTNLSFTNANSAFAIWDRYIDAMEEAETLDDLHEVCYALALFKRSRGFSTYIEEYNNPLFSTES